VHGDHAVPIELDFVEPARPRWQFIDRQAIHGLYKTRLGHARYYKDRGEVCRETNGLKTPLPASL
jgi:hypothetical protein